MHIAIDSLSVWKSIKNITVFTTYEIMRRGKTADLCEEKQKER